MSRQHATPLLLSDAGAIPLTPLPLGAGPDQISEAALQSLLHAHPGLLPIAEIDPIFADPVPICIELNTPAGPIDNLLVTRSGLPVLVECKLWRNAEARREVVGQILDYAKELSRWTASDLQREVSRRIGRGGNVVFEMVEARGADQDRQGVDEASFNDALTLNLRKGRCLLLILGDGIREGVEAIAEYLQVHAGLHFTLGLVELPVFRLPDGTRLVTPRVVARTTQLAREVVILPDGFAIRPAEAPEPKAEDRLSDYDSSRRDFLQEVVDGLVLDDPDQPRPRVSPKGWLYLYLPAPASSCWISVLDKRSTRQIGVRLTSNAQTIGESAIRRIVEDWPGIQEQLGPEAELDDMGSGRFRVQQFLAVDREGGPADQRRAVDWLRERINDYVTTFRPRVRDAVARIEE